MTNNARDERYKYYWEKFEEHLKGTDSKLSMSRSSRRRNGKTFSPVANGLAVDAIPALGSTNKKDEITCCVEALLDHSSNPAYNKDAFEKLYSDREEIEKNIGLKLCWLRNGEQDNAKRSKISFCKVFDSNLEEDWHEHYPWFIETIEKFVHVFTHRLEDIEDKR